MNKFFVLVLPTIVGVIVGGVWILKANVTYCPIVPRDVARDISTEDLKKLERQMLEERNPSVRDNSQAVADRSEHHFGTMDAFASGQTSFVIRNEGSEPLFLGDPQVDRESTTAEFSQREVPPGAYAKVNVTWNVELADGEYTTSLIIPTSDPTNRHLKFSIAGQAERRFEVTRNGFAFPPTAPDVTPEPQETLVFSRVCDDLKLIDAQCDLASANFTTAELSPAELAELGAKSGYRVKVALPSDLPSGFHSGKLQMAFHSESLEATYRNELSIGCKVQRRLCFYGKDISTYAVIDLGVTSPGVEKRTQLLVKVRDAVTELPNARVEVEPSFVQARLLPQPLGSNVQGHYLLEVVVPANAPLCAHLRTDQFGTLKIRTDHPRIPEEELKVRFAVAAPER